jgi:hypothetical protein
VAGRLWSSAGRALARALDRTGVGLTVLWAWLVGAGGWLGARYRDVAGRLWSSAVRGLVRALGLAGAALTQTWAWLVRAGIRTLVWYRAAMRWLWSTVPRAVTLLFAGIGAGVAWLWAWLLRAGASTLAVCSAGMRELWSAAVGRNDEAPRKPLRRWYGAAVNSAFGIPPQGVSLDEVRRRRTRRPMPANRPRPHRPAYRGDRETVASRERKRVAPEAELTLDPRARYVGRQVTRRGQRRKSEELLAAALARFRSSASRPRDREDGIDD